MSVALFSALKNWGWIEVLCWSRRTQPLRLLAAQSPTMAETLHPAFSGVQQYTGREARRPAPREAPPRRSPAPRARPSVFLSLTFLPTSSRGPIPALCPAGPAPQVLPKVGLGPAPSLCPRLSSPGCSVAWAPPALGRLCAVAPPRLLPKTHCRPRPQPGPRP